MHHILRWHFPWPVNHFNQHDSPPPQSLLAQHSPCWFEMDTDGPCSARGARTVLGFGHLKSKPTLQQFSPTFFPRQTSNRPCPSSRFHNKWFVWVHSHCVDNVWLEVWIEFFDQQLPAAALCPPPWCQFNARDRRTSCPPVDIVYKLQNWAVRYTSAITNSLIFCTIWANHIFVDFEQGSSICQELLVLRKL